MKIECDTDDLITIMQNNETICQAMQDFGKQFNNANTGVDILFALPGALKNMSNLVIQAVKSNTAVMNSIRERNFLDDGILH